MKQRMLGATNRAAATLQADTSSFYEAFQELIRAYQFRDRDRAGCRGLSVTECYALEAIDRDGPLAVNDLAARLNLDKSRVSRLAAAMEARKWVTRRRDVPDGRILRLTIAPAGKRLHDSVKADLVKRQERLLGPLDHETRLRLTELVRGLREDLRTRACEVAGPETAKRLRPGDRRCG